MEISKQRQTCKSELEIKMAANNLGSSWASMKSIVDDQGPKSSIHVIFCDFDLDTEFANALNHFIVA